MGIKHKKNMYNEALKKEYIEHAISSGETQNPELYEKSMFNRFVRASKFEEQIGKDICEMNRSEVESFLRSFLSGGQLYRMNSLSTLRSYVEWVTNNRVGASKENFFYGIKVTDIDTTNSYVDTMVENEDDLIENLDLALNEISRNTADNAIRCIFLLIYFGIKFKDVFFIKKEDLDIKNKVILYGSQTIYLSDTACEMLSYYIKMDKIQVIGKGMGVEYERDIINEGYLISNKHSFGADRDKMRIGYTSGISKAMESCPKKLKPDSVHDSGVFYRMYQKEKQTGTIDCIEYLMARKHQKAVMTTPDRIKKICIQEYETWKRAFDL